MQVKSEEYLPIRQKLFQRIFQFSKKIGDDKFEKNCLYTIKSQYIHPLNIHNGKINLALIMCFTDSQGEVKKIFTQEFVKKFTETLNESPLYKFTQKLEIAQSLYLKYFEHELNLNNLSKYTKSRKTEFPNYYTELTEEGIVSNTREDESPNSVKFAFRYDQVIKCSGFNPEKFKQYVNKKLQGMFGKNECCVIYVTDWNVYANTHLFCSNQKENWKCAAEIQIFKASFYNRCLMSNISDLHKNLKKNSGLSAIEESDFLVKARMFYILHEVSKIDLKFVAKETEMFSYINKYKNIAVVLMQKLEEIIKPYCKTTFTSVSDEEETIDCIFYFLNF